MAEAICNISERKEWWGRREMVGMLGCHRVEFSSAAAGEYVISAALPDRLTLPLSLLILICMWKLPRAARGAIIALFLTRTVAFAPLRLFVYYLLRVCRHVGVCACVCVCGDVC